MTTVDAAAPRRPAISPAFFATAIFASAALVFLVEPMIAKLVLPLLGGGPSIWNTSLAFFQAALLVGYGYANLLQRLRSVRSQVIVHAMILAAAALVLPLRVHEALGPPTSDHPVMWLLGVLTLSIGPPFAILSATAPLVQAWYARVMHVGEGKGPYSLYAASNLGSLIALLAYPIVVEPMLAVHTQTVGWSAAYIAFLILMTSLGLVVARARDQGPAEVVRDLAERPVTWRERLIWVALAAIPSSLMLGVTTHITTDVASAPFLWVLPLALYLLTFVIAFQDRPLIRPETTLMFQAAAAAAAAVLMPFKVGPILVLMFVQLAGFFLTALMCHQAMVARRPPPGQLTQFYFWMSLGGVLGGGFNAFVAPVIFNNVWEYPLVLVLSALARPWDRGPIKLQRWIWLAIVVLGAAAAPVLSSHGVDEIYIKLMLAGAVVGVFILRKDAGIYFIALTLVTLSAFVLQERTTGEHHTWRSFFGVLRQTEGGIPQLGGTVHMLAHGSTLHGAQAQDPRWRCRPLTYYAPETPIGQVFTSVRARKTAINVGAVGLGTGTVSAYTRPGDHLTFFEIDPLVKQVSTDPAHFSYTTYCAKGRVDFVIGDARLTVARQPAGVFDILLIDAFSSDSVPAHLLTVEAVRNYLQRLKPDGVLILHLSNRNLELRSPAIAVAHAAGGVALLQRHEKADSSPVLWESAEDALIIARDAHALAPFAADSRWTDPGPPKVRAWTDDYTNVPGALYARLKEAWRWLP